MRHSAPKWAIHVHIELFCCRRVAAAPLLRPPPSTRRPVLSLVEAVSFHSSIFMTFLRAAFLTAAALCAVQYAVLAQDITLKVVNAGNVRYQSDVSLDVGVTSFLGIRYAAPPIGQPSSLR